MALYNYTARSISGKIVNGTMQVSNKQELYTKLQKEQKYLIKCKEEADIIVTTSKSKLKVADLVFFCRQMEAMLSAGITVVKAIDLIAKKTENPKNRKIFMELFETVQKGTSLSEAMTKQGDTFPKMLINMIFYGEASGKLDYVMGQMAEHYRKEAKTKNQIKSAMNYPMILGILSVVIVIFLLVAIMPKIVTMIPEDQALPTPTRILMALSDAIKAYWYIFIVVILLIVFGIKAILKQPKARLKFDRFKMRGPKIGKMNRTVATSRFASTLASLYSSGIPIIECINISVRVLNNAYVSEIFKGVVEDLNAGSGMYESMVKIDFFDSMFISMVFVGEESGQLDKVLGQTSGFFEDEAETALKKLISLVEPIMICLLAVIIAFIILSIMMPMFAGMSTT